jgi:ComF family protein
VLDSVFAVAFPTRCPFCASELTSDLWLRICRDCWASLEPWTGPLCARCGLPFSSSRALDSSLAQCGACRRAETAFDGARSFGLYTGKLRLAVLRVKFNADERLGVRLGELLESIWSSFPQLAESSSTRIVPVPLHPSRRRERGFNQSELLAAGLAHALKRRHGSAPRIAASCLRRKRATAPQIGLSVAARRENLRGAFEVVEADALDGRIVVLVDDVMTTGATVSACARALKRAGAAQVLALTLARATPQFPDFARVESDNTVDGLGYDST